MEDDDSLEAFAAGLTFTAPPQPTAIEARPFLKWVGGKAKLVTALVDLFPRRVRRYYEPFLGGGALFWTLAEAKRFEAASLNDWNDELVTTYRVVRDFPEDLIRHLEDMARNYKTAPEATFKAWKDPPAPLGPVERAARFVFLNRTGFNGLYRLNGSGKYNVPWGKYPNPAICNAPLLRGCSMALNQLVTITRGDFADACKDAGDGDLVYLDPPYVPVSETSNFTSYTEQGFSLDDQYRVAALFKQLHARGCAVLLSNSDTPEVRALFAGYEMHAVPMRRNVNSKGDGRGPIDELIIVSRRAPPRLDVPL